MANQSHRSSRDLSRPPPLSKRQRRAQGPNPSNTWQQQPRIKSASARARAYISYAGLADEQDGRAASSAGKNKSSSSSGNNRNRPEDLLDPKLDLHSPEVKFGRLLGGTDQRLRHQAVKMLREYLRARSDISSGVGLSELDLLKLWKGLWYTLYMADKTPVQDKLSKILAELMWCLSGTEEEDEYAGQVYCLMTDGEDNTVLYEDGDGDTMEIIEMDEGSDDSKTNDNGEGGADGEENEYSMEEDGDGEHEDDDEQRIKDMNEVHCRGAHLVSLYVSTFLQTVRREWGNVDKHRVDKFYTAVRFMVSEVYKYMSKRRWNFGIIRLFNDVLYEEGLSADTPGLTNGLRYHLIDICVDELAKVNKDAELPLTEATILDCLEPFFGLAQKAADKKVQRRVMDNVLLKFLNEHSFVCPMAIMDDTREEQEAKALIFNQVHVGTVSQFIFDIASNNTTDERFRKSLYEMHKTFVRQIRVAGRDVDMNHYLEDEEPEKADLGDELGDDGGEGGKCNDSQYDGEKENPNEQDIGVVSANAESDSADDITSSVTKYENTQNKKRRKKKKNKGKKEIGKELDGAAPETPKKPCNEEHPNAATPAKSSSKKRKKNKSVPTGIGLACPTSEVKTHNTPKEKKHKSLPSVDPQSMHSPDQVISPDSSDNETGNGNANAVSASKRVMFKAMNHCKSHKASMKAIKVLEKERWDTKSRTPDKGILRPKGRKSSEKGNRSLDPSSSRKRGTRQT